MIQLTNEMNEAVRLIRTTNTSLFITGKAGTGKTTLLKHISDTIDKNIVVTAPTGIAAINANGATLHSVFMIPFGVLHPDYSMKFDLRKEKSDILKMMDVLVIDEISMVRPDVLDYVNRRLQMYRRNKEPFGGVQLVMIGDLFQLPPVVTSNEEVILNSLYKTEYFFSANVFKQIKFRVIELKNVFRQREEEYINVLNHIRTYQLSDEDEEILAEMRSSNDAKDFSNDYIHICAKKSVANKINKTFLGAYKWKNKAELDGAIDIKNVPCSNILKLRVGAKVMLTANKAGEYYNGSLGIVNDLKEDAIVVELESGEVVEVKKNTWETYKYTQKDKELVKEVAGTCEQYPVILAYAITIHKSQGLTFNKVAIHTKGMFAPGQLYTALSRGVSIDGIVTDSFITQKHIFVDHRLLEFEDTYQKNGGWFGEDNLSLAN